MKRLVILVTALVFAFCATATAFEILPSKELKKAQKIEVKAQKKEAKAYGKDVRKAEKAYDKEVRKEEKAASKWRRISTK